MAIKDGYIRWSDDAVGAIRWDTEEKEGLAVVIDEANGEVYEIGGGGESDFSTAEVTFYNTLGTGTRGAYIAQVACTVDIEDVYSGSISAFEIQRETTNNKSVILYKGKAMLVLLGADSVPPEITGDIAPNETLGPNTYVITGDCSINCAGIEIIGG